MSMWLRLLDAEGSSLESATRIQEGGTQVVGGTNDCELNITYNYCAVYRLVDFDVERDLEGKKAADTIEKLQKAVDKLGTRKHQDYWAPTPGNSGYALSILLGWAKEHPEGVWKGSY